MWLSAFNGFPALTSMEGVLSSSDSGTTYIDDVSSGPIEISCDYEYLLVDPCSFPRARRPFRPPPARLCRDLQLR